MAQKLTQEQRKQYAKIFVELDTDGNGWLSREEVGTWLKNSGYNLTDQEQESLFRWMDGNADGRITLDEFLKAMQMINKTTSSFERSTSRESSTSQSSARPGASGPKDLQSVFDSMDTDGDGQLSEDELLNGLTRAGYSVNRQQIKKLVANLDRDGDGQISYDEFIRAFKPQK